MNRPYPPDPEIIRPDRPGDSVLGPADPRQLALAAEELRDRTMQLEEVRIFPSWRFFVTVIVLVFATAALALLFRAELRALFKLIGS